MRNRLLIAVLGLGLISPVFLLAAGQDYIIRSNLFIGRHGLRSADPDIVISSQHLTHQPTPEDSLGTNQQEIEHLMTQLQSVYQLDSVDYLASNSLLWDGKAKPMKSSIVLNSNLCPIVFTPRKIDKNQISLRVEILKKEPESVSGQSGLAFSITPLSKRPDSSSLAGFQKVLDTEIVMKLDDSVVLGFPSNGQKFFLSVNIARKTLRTIYNRMLGSRIREINLLETPKSVRQINPVYPEECEIQEIEGVVVLQVSIDSLGTVVDAKVIKKAHPLLDEAALTALKEWTFEPVILGKKAVPVTFNVTVNFRLPNEQHP